MTSHLRFPYRPKKFHIRAQILPWDHLASPVLTRLTWSYNSAALQQRDRQGHSPDPLLTLEWKSKESPVGNEMSQGLHELYLEFARKREKACAPVGYKAAHHGSVRALKGSQICWRYRAASCPQPIRRESSTKPGYQIVFPSDTKQGHTLVQEKKANSEVARKTHIAPAKASKSSPKRAWRGARCSSPARRWHSLHRWEKNAQEDQLKQNNTNPHGRIRFALVYSGFFSAREEISLTAAIILLKATLSAQSLLWDEADPRWSPKGLKPNRSNVSKKGQESWGCFVGFYKLSCIY